MSIKVTVKNPIDAIIYLKANKTLDGNILILDHPDIDIMVSPSKKKILALSKYQYGDHIYATESRLFDFLTKKGIVEYSSVRGGNIYGSLEGVLLESTEPETISSVQMALYSITKFLLQEKPHYHAIKQYEIEFEKSLLDPDEADSTELGEIPHEKRQGSLNQYAGVNTAYGLYGTYG